jgi:hypothetical protein
MGSMIEPKTYEKIKKKKLKKSGKKTERRKLQI